MNRFEVYKLNGSQEQENKDTFGRYQLVECSTNPNPSTHQHSPYWAEGNSRMSFEADLPPCGEYPLFVEMAQLDKDEWRETARWVKYEEDIEEGGQRWSKPYVSAIHVSAVYDLRRILENAEIQLNLDCRDEEKACRLLAEAWVERGTISESEKSKILQKLLRPHVHLYETHASLAHLFKRKKDEHHGSSKDIRPPPSSGNASRRGSILSVVYQPQQKDDNQKNKHFLRKIPENSECANIMVGAVPGLQKPVAAFIRLSDATILGNFTEVPLPTRFIFVLFTPSSLNHLELGRAMGTMLTDPGFKELAYRASSKEQILKGIDQFLQSTSILPPSVWDPSIRLEPHGPDEHHGGSEGHEEETVDDGLQRTGKPFGGLYQDLRRKIPWYLSDFKDALSLQVISTWLFLYFACLTPMITFGGLMGEATHNMMGTMETMVSGCVCGIGFALFGGQPLLILGSTGPVLVFEKILVSFAESNDLKYLEFRLWVGLWIAFFLLVIVATEASALVKYITKFTEDNFATLIACIFMYEAIKNVIHIKDDHIVLKDINLNFSTESPEANETLYEMFDRLKTQEGHSRFLMSLLLFFATFFVAYMLKEFRISSFCPTWFRYLISDFAVILAIICMTGVDILANVSTPKLEVPEKFAPTSDARGWLISPIDENPMWSIFAAAIPALLATILIFMDQQITAVIVNRKDHKLQKGSGYHLDLFVLSLLIIVGSFFGLPWFVAATVESLTNVGSLKMESETAAPGEKPTFLGVREQRVSNLLVFTTVGFSVLLTPVLKYVPMPVLYGVFLYMGFSALMRMELFHRILLLFMPLKYQPDYDFLRHVPLRKVHFFTMIQVLCLAILWTIKSIPATAIAFPLMLVVMMIVRKCLDFVFTQSELLALDDALPGAKQEQKEIASKAKFNNNHKRPSIATVQISMNEQ